MTTAHIIIIYSLKRHSARDVQVQVITVFKNWTCFKAYLSYCSQLELLNPHLGPWSVSAETAVGPGDCDDACALRVGQKQLRHWDKINWDTKEKTETYYVLHCYIIILMWEVILRTVEFASEVQSFEVENSKQKVK